MDGEKKGMFGIPPTIMDSIKERNRWEGFMINLLGIGPFLYLSMLAPKLTEESYSREFPPEFNKL